MQDLSGIMSAAGPSRPSCARSLNEDLSIRMSASRSCRTSCSTRSLYEISNRNLPNISSGRHARSPQGVALRHPKSQFHLYSAHATRTISAEGCISKSKNAISPAFRALDTHDLRRGLRFEIRNRNCTCIPRARHARSPQRVAFRNPKSQFHLHSAHLTRAISAEGCTSKSKNTIAPAFRAFDTHDFRRGFTFRNHASEVLRLPRNHEPRSYEALHWPRKRILKLKLQKCNPSQELSPLTSKYWTHGMDSLHLHVKCNPSNDTRLPMFWQRPRNTAPAMIFTMCPIPCPCHVNSRF